MGNGLFEEGLETHRAGHIGFSAVPGTMYMERNMNDRPVVSFQAVRALRYALVPLVAMMLASGIFHWTGFDLTSLSEAVTAYVPSSDDRLAPLRLRESGARMMWSITVLLYLRSASNS